MDKLVQIGAGNIGRRFHRASSSRGPASRSCSSMWSPRSSPRSTSEHRYPVEIKDRVPETIWVEQRARGRRPRRAGRGAGSWPTCRCCGTAVGPKALPYIYPTSPPAWSCARPRARRPLDVIICENMRDAAAAMRAGLAEHLPPDFPLDDTVGLVETSIGKMVPIMSDEDRASDPLLVYAEAYNTLICDATAFRNPIPDVPGLDPKQNMNAYVDRKSFIHNFGPRAPSLGHLEAPDLMYTWEAVEHPRVGPAVRAGMWESAAALINAYPEEFSEETRASTSRTSSALRQQGPRRHPLPRGARRAPQAVPRGPGHRRRCFDAWRDGVAPVHRPVRRGRHALPGP